MARKKIIDLDCDSTVAFEKVGQSTEGYYIGFKNITTDYGPSKLHVFQGEDGNFGIYGSAKIDEKLASVPAGHLTFVTFNGKVKIPGGKTMKKFDVEYDDEAKIDVENTQVNFSSTTTQEPEAEEQSEEPAEEEANEEPADVDDSTIEAAETEEAEEEPKNPVKKPLKPARPAAAATMLNAEKKKSVESLLSKTKR